MPESITLHSESQPEFCNCEHFAPADIESDYCVLCGLPYKESVIPALKPLGIPEIPSDQPDLDLFNLSE